MLTIVPNEDGEMVAVPIHVQDENDDEEGTKMEVHMEGDENADGEVYSLFYDKNVTFSNRSSHCRKFNNFSL